MDEFSLFATKANNPNLKPVLTPYEVGQLVFLKTTEDAYGEKHIPSGWLLIVKISGVIHVDMCNQHVYLAYHLTTRTKHPIVHADIIDAEPYSESTT